MKLNRLGDKLKGSLTETDEQKRARQVWGQGEDAIDAHEKLQAKKAAEAEQARIGRQALLGAYAKQLEEGKQSGVVHNSDVQRAKITGEIPKIPKHIEVTGSDSATKNVEVSVE